MPFFYKNVSFFLYISELLITALFVNVLNLYFSLNLKELVPNYRVGQVKL
jgi:hypothetical protein